MEDICPYNLYLYSPLFITASLCVCAVVVLLHKFRTFRNIKFHCVFVQLWKRFIRSVTHVCCSGYQMELETHAPSLNKYLNGNNIDSAFLTSLGGGGSVCSSLNSYYETKSDCIVCRPQVLSMSELHIKSSKDQTSELVENLKHYIDKRIFEIVNGLPNDTVDTTLSRKKFINSMSTIRSQEFILKNDSEIVLLKSCPAGVNDECLQSSDTVVESVEMDRIAPEDENYFSFTAKRSNLPDHDSLKRCENFLNLGHSFSKITENKATMTEPQTDVLGLVEFVQNILRTKPENEEQRDNTLSPEENYPTISTVTDFDDQVKRIYSETSSFLLEDEHLSSVSDDSAVNDDTGSEVVSSEEFTTETVEETENIELMGDDYFDYAYYSPLSKFIPLPPLVESGVSDVYLALNSDSENHSEILYDAHSPKDVVELSGIRSTNSMEVMQSASLHRCGSILHEGFLEDSRFVSTDIKKDSNESDDNIQHNIDNNTLKESPESSKIESADSKQRCNEFDTRSACKVENNTRGAASESAYIEYSYSEQDHNKFLSNNTMQVDVCISKETFQSADFQCSNSKLNLNIAENFTSEESFKTTTFDQEDFKLNFEALSVNTICKVKNNASEILSDSYDFHLVESKQDNDENNKHKSTTFDDKNATNIENCINKRCLECSDFKHSKSKQDLNEYQNNNTRESQNNVTKDKLESSHSDHDDMIPDLSNDSSVDNPCIETNKCIEISKNTNSERMDSIHDLREFCVHPEDNCDPVRYNMVKLTESEENIEQEIRKYDHKCIGNIITNKEVLNQPESENKFCEIDINEIYGSCLYNIETDESDKPIEQPLFTFKNLKQDLKESNNKASQTIICREFPDVVSESASSTVKQISRSNDETNQVAINEAFENQTSVIQNARNASLKIYDKDIRECYNEIESGTLPLFALHKVDVASLVTEGKVIEENESQISMFDKLLMESSSEELEEESDIQSASEKEDESQISTITLNSSPGGKIKEVYAEMDETKLLYTQESVEAVKNKRKRHDVGIEEGNKQNMASTFPSEYSEVSSTTFVGGETESSTDHSFNKESITCSSSDLNSYASTVRKRKKTINKSSVLETNSSYDSSVDETTVRNTVVNNISEGDTNSTIKTLTTDSSVESFLVYESKTQAESGVLSDYSYTEIIRAKDASFSEDMVDKTITSTLPEGKALAQNKDFITGGMEVGTNLLETSKHMNTMSDSLEAKQVLQEVEMTSTEHSRENSSSCTTEFTSGESMLTKAFVMHKSEINSVKTDELDKSLITETKPEIDSGIKCIEICSSKSRLESFIDGIENETQQKSSGMFTVDASSQKAIVGEENRNDVHDIERRIDVAEYPMDELDNAITRGFWRTGASLSDYLSTENTTGPKVKVTDSLEAIQGSVEELSRGEGIINCPSQTTWDIKECEAIQAHITEEVTPLPKESSLSQTRVNEIFMPDSLKDKDFRDSSVPKTKSTVSESFTGGIGESAECYCLLKNVYSMTYSSSERDENDHSGSKCTSNNLKLIYNSQSLVDLGENSDDVLHRSIHQCNPEVSPPGIFTHKHVLYTSSTTDTLSDAIISDPEALETLSSTEPRSCSETFELALKEELLQSVVFDTKDHIKQKEDITVSSRIPSLGQCCINGKSLKTSKLWKSDCPKRSVSEDNAKCITILQEKNQKGTDCFKNVPDCFMKSEITVSLTDQEEFYVPCNSSIEVIPDDDVSLKITDFSEDSYNSFASRISLSSTYLETETPSASAMMPSLQLFVNGQQNTSDRKELEESRKMTAELSIVTTKASELSNSLTSNSLGYEESTPLDRANAARYFVTAGGDFLDDQGSPDALSLHAVSNHLSLLAEAERRQGQILQEASNDVLQNDSYTTLNLASSTELLNKISDDSSIKSSKTEGMFLATRRKLKHHKPESKFLLTAMRNLSLAASNEFQNFLILNNLLSVFASRSETSFSMKGSKSDSSLFPLKVKKITNKTFLITFEETSSLCLMNKKIMDRICTEQESRPVVPKKLFVDKTTKTDDELIVNTSDAQISTDNQLEIRIESTVSDKSTMTDVENLSETKIKKINSNQRITTDTKEYLEDTEVSSTGCIAARETNMSSLSETSCGISTMVFEDETSQINQQKEIFTGSIEGSGELSKISTECLAVSEDIATSGINKLLPEISTNSLFLNKSVKAAEQRISKGTCKVHKDVKESLWDRTSKDKESAECPCRSPDKPSSENMILTTEQEKTQDRLIVHRSMYQAGSNLLTSSLDLSFLCKLDIPPNPCLFWLESRFDKSTSSTGLLSAKDIMTSTADLEESISRISDGLSDETVQESTTLELRSIVENTPKEILDVVEESSEKENSAQEELDSHTQKNSLVDMPLSPSSSNSISIDTNNTNLPLKCRNSTQKISSKQSISSRNEREDFGKCIAGLEESMNKAASLLQKLTDNFVLSENLILGDHINKVSKSYFDESEDTFNENMDDIGGKWKVSANTTTYTEQSYNSNSISDSMEETINKANSLIEKLSNNVTSSENIISEEESISRSFADDLGSSEVSRKNKVKIDIDLKFIAMQHFEIDVDTASSTTTITTVESDLSFDDM